MDALSVLHYAKNLLYFWSIYLHNSKKSVTFARYLDKNTQIIRL